MVSTKNAKAMITANAKINKQKTKGKKNERVQRLHTIKAYSDKNKWL